MNAEIFSKALGNVADRYVVEALNYSAPKKHKWIGWSAAAACACAVALAVWILPPAVRLERSDSGGDGGGLFYSDVSDENSPATVFSLFASEDVSTEIQKDIPENEPLQWTQDTNAAIDYSHMMPIYSPMRVSKDSRTVLETLSFDGYYIVPVLSDEKCLGTFTLTQYQGKWTVACYTVGFDLESAVRTYADHATCFFSLSPFSGECGFLIVSDTEESYISLNNLIQYSEDGQVLLDRLKENLRTNHRDADVSDG